MPYCWEIYNKSNCSSCELYQNFQSGKLNLQSSKDIVIIADDWQLPLKTK